MAGSVEGKGAGDDLEIEEAGRVAGAAVRSRRIRLTILLALCGLTLLVANAAVAEDSPHKSMVGQRVVQRSNDFTLRIKDQVVDRHRVIHFYKVEQVNGPWLWVRAEGNGFSGWAKAEDVIPIDEGVDFFSERIREDSQDAFAYVMRAMLWQDRNQVDRALQDYDAVLRLDPSEGWIYNNRGILHFEQKHYDKAVEDFNKAIEIEPKVANLYNNRGNARRGRHLYDLAIADFSEAIRLDPTYIYAYYDRGLTFAEKKDYDRAIVDFNQVIHLDSKDVLAYYHRGLAWAAKGEHDSAIADFDHAVALDGKLSFVYTDRGLAWAAKKDYTKAIADFSTSIRMSPHRTRSYYNRALAYIELKLFDKALADFDATIRVNPEFDEAYLRRAWLLATCPNVRLRDPKKAVESATRACELTHWHEAHDIGGLAAVCAETGHVTEALKWHSKAIELMTHSRHENDDLFALDRP
ncbi:MAG: tetratricopeptide repeat protein [Isosphaeraceae bacterium]